MSQIGTKHDGQKPRWSLLPGGTIAKVIAVLEFGAAKYRIDNWQHIEDPDRRYYDAAMRHIQAWLYGEIDDPESGLPHLAHAVCCLLFLMWFDNQKAKKKDDLARICRESVSLSQVEQVADQDARKSEGKR